ncbi:hypothetical protein [Absidia glauca]|uniref:Uncharacterized protein n=1 Tax=Absidia glauca TaxID=4829 RepID=A0A163KU36_ABSGL|nr:hypothetical protein [Absidia glauca]
MSICSNKWKLSLEDHIHLALAATSILLLTRDHYSNDLKPAFTPSNIEATMDYIDNMYSIKRSVMDMTTTTDMIGILEVFATKKFTRNQATIRLLGLDLPVDQSKFREGVLNLIKKLPRVPLQETTNENELTSRYIDLLLCGLFDDQENGFYLLWTNEATLDARKHDDF